MMTLSFRFQVQLLQVSPTDSPLEIFQDFLGQIPAPLVYSVCGAGLMLVVAFAWFAYFKPLRNARRQRQAATSTASEAPATPSTSPQQQPTKRETPAASRKADADLPDLDMLVDPSSLTKELPDVDAPGGAGQASQGSPQVKSDQEQPARQRRGGTYRVPLADGGSVRAKEELAVLRDPRDGRLMIQLNGQGYRTLSGHPDAKETFVTLMRELSDVIKKPDDNPPSQAEEPEQEDVPTATPPPMMPDGTMPGDLPSYRVDDNIQPTRGGTYRTTPPQSFNIADAIEAYLQYKLKHTPEYSDHVLHVMASPNGGVRIQVDDTFYEAVSDIEDDDIRTFLSQTIQEWQARQ